MLRGRLRRSGRVEGLRLSLDVVGRKLLVGVGVSSFEIQPGNSKRAVRKLERGHTRLSRGDYPTKQRWKSTFTALNRSPELGAPRFRTIDSAPHMQSDLVCTSYNFAPHRSRCFRFLLQTMDMVLQKQLDRLEIALSKLLDSITTYNPSLPAAHDLLAAEEELGKGLEQRMLRIVSCQ